MSYIFRAMRRQVTQKRYRWLVTAAMLLLLGGQVLQSVHLHADHGVTSDCVQCQAEGGNAMAVTGAVTPACLPAVDEIHPDITVATIATFYRLSARGPPALSS